GQSVIAGGFLGGEIGDEVEALLEREGVRCNFIRVLGNTRINVTVSEKNTHLQTRLSFPGPTLLPKEIKRLFRWVKNLSHPSLLVVGGSLPPGISPKAVRKMIEISHGKGIPCVVDVPGKTLKILLECKSKRAQPLLIKPNLIEFQELIGKRVKSIQDVAK